MNNQHPKTLSSPRTLVVAADGTADQFDSNNSNIVKLVSLLRKHDPTRQKIYYQSGVGTYVDPGEAATGVVSTTLDYMFANTLGGHVRDAYEFLMDHYAAGDKICLFGFSRGAYTVRGLAGMLQKVGLLPPGNKESIRAAYKLYAREDQEGLELCKAYKASFAIDVDIQFVGVFDTVASVGIAARTLPFVSTNDSIRFFRQALALDERRAKFMPVFYKSTTDADDANELQRDTDEQSTDGKAWVTDSKEVFFAGSHSDVGGGSVPNHTRFALARIPLRWMIRECFETQTGLIFDMDRLHYELGLGINFKTRELLPVSSQLLPLHNRDRIRTPANDGVSNEPGRRGDVMSEAEEELNDALSPLYDSLALIPAWWVLELVPLIQLRQREFYEMSDQFVWMINRGRGRKVFKHIARRGIHVHRSVLARLLAQDHEGSPQTYVPQIRPNLRALPGGRKVLTPAERLSWTQWESQDAGLDVQWFQWVDPVDVNRYTSDPGASEQSH